LKYVINPSNAQLNPICYLLALLGDHPVLHVNRLRVKEMTQRKIEGRRRCGMKH
jgi:hypothetical protein